MNKDLPITEQDNPRTSGIDAASTLDAVRMINAEDGLVAGAVEKVLPEIAAAVDQIVERMRKGGRLFYIGTGTSGRLGVLDASEIPPTYGVPYELVQGIIAGGYAALYQATEASEDSHEAGGADLRERGVTGNDSVIGLAASGRTPYTIGALEYARSIGCFTAAVTCVPDSAITKECDIAIVPIVGAEPITGSTRMKSGTAQKLILNTISTVTMVKLGYVKGNRMTNVKPANIKLRERSVRILASETGISPEEAETLFVAAGEDLRVALVMKRSGASREISLKTLEENGYVIEAAVAKINTKA